MRNSRTAPRRANQRGRVSRFYIRHSAFSPSHPVLRTADCCTGQGFFASPAPGPPGGGEAGGWDAPQMRNTQGVPECGIGFEVDRLVREEVRGLS
jgi:hypothetical protein